MMEADFMPQQLLLLQLCRMETLDSNHADRTKLSDEFWRNYNMSIISKSSKFLNKKGANQCPIIPTGHVSDIN